ncbi:cadmium resistance transporter [Floridanema evergladense]|uniref:Cadmium resistance transporter n=1 Tax=Floridaenema evergladense BLCC-F167 TaxID=3153639 RepID=A0ABV4WEE2_9CYAN
MTSIGTAITEGIIAFAATNIDDIIILLLLFSQLGENFRRRNIIIGQYLGFAVLVAASLPGYFGGLVVKQEWIGLLGLLPIAIGIKQLIDRNKDTAQVQTVSNDFQQNLPSNSLIAFILSIFNPKTYQVAAITIANGGDNISIYIPLFAGQNLNDLLVILGVFFIMVGVWCGIAYSLTLHPNIAYLLSRYGKPIVPFVLIGLGLFIMYERGTFEILRSTFN